MNIDKKLLYGAVVIIGLALVAGPVYGLRMRKEAEKYKRINGEQEKEVAELDQRINETEQTIRNLKKKQQQTVADLTKKQNQLQKELHEAQGEKSKLNQVIEVHQSQAEKNQKRLSELTLANEDLRQRNQTVLAEVAKARARTQELVSSKTELTEQLRQIESQAGILAEARKKEEETVRVQKKLTSSLRNEIAAGQVKITQLAGKTTVRLKEKFLFESSKASIKASGLAVLKKVGQALQKIQGKHIQVQGHTDSRPIAWALKRKYSTNWELSAARATTIVRYLIDEVGVEPTRLSAAGYAFYQPLASNDTPEGRRENRRVEFVLLPL